MKAAHRQSTAVKGGKRLQGPLRIDLSSVLLTLLSFSLLLQDATPLVTGKIVVKKSQPQGWIRYSDGDDTCSKLAVDVNDDEAERVITDHQTKWNATQHIYRMRPKRHLVRSTMSYETIEEKERRTLDWIVRNTDKILGPDSPGVGRMSQGSIELTYDLMNAWSRRASRREGSKAPHVVERLLKRLITEQDAAEGIVVDTEIYNIVLTAWSNSNEEGSAERSEEILLQMERMYLEDGNTNVKPNEDSYNAVIKAYVKNGNRSVAAPKAESLVKHMEEQECSIGVSPTKRSYNLLLYSLANSNLEDAGAHADDILHRMLERYNDRNQKRCKPDINSYNQVLTCWARGKASNYEDRMHELYQGLLSLPKHLEILPNTDTFNAVMGGWLKSDRPEALQMIEDILEEMEHSYASGNAAAKPDRITINTLAAANTKSGCSEAVEKSLLQTTELEQKYQVMATTVSYNIVLDKWCKSGRSDAPDRALDLLDTMERDFKRGKSDVRPDGYSFSSVIGCFVRFKRSDATRVAEDIVERMQDLYLNYGGEAPTTSVFNAALNAWASQPQTKDALKHVSAYMDMMDRNDGDNPLIPKPNRITYNTVIKAMRDGKTENAETAEKILTKLEDKGQQDASLLPDSYSYTSVITAYGRSDSPRKAQKALEILKRMIQAKERGNMAAVSTTHSFNAALNACAFVRGNKRTKLEAFDTAMEIHDLLKELSVADHTTFGTLLRICATLLEPSDPRRQEMVDQLFEKACSSGNVGRLVITQLKFAAAPDQFFRLTGRKSTERIDVKDFPRDWTRNVREATRRHR